MNAQAIPPNMPTTTFPAHMTDLLRLVRAEYREMPGLRLTQRQAQRLWNLDSTTCEAILETLESTRFLRRTSDHSYVLVACDQ
jgi:DNA-binding IclR family transcriptional regulator